MARGWWNVQLAYPSISYLANFRAPTTHKMTATVTANIIQLTGSCSSVAARPGPKMVAAIAIGHGGDAALCKAAIPENETDQHAEERHIGEAKQAGNSMQEKGRRLIENR